MHSVVISSSFTKTDHAHIQSYTRRRVVINNKRLPFLDGWMTINFTSFSTLFQSDQDDERVIIKGYGQWSPVHDRKDLRRGSNPGPLDQ